MKLKTNTGNRLIKFFYERVPECQRAQKHHGGCYRDIMRREYVTAIYGLHYLIQFGYWAQDKWFNHAFPRKSWIDRIVDERVRAREQAAERISAIQKGQRDYEKWSKWDAQEDKSAVY